MDFDSFLNRKRRYFFGGSPALARLLWMVSVAAAFGIAAYLIYQVKSTQKPIKINEPFLLIS